MSGPITCTLSLRQNANPEVVDLRFQVLEPSGFSFKPGQFLTLSVGQDDKGKQLRRSYSLGSLASTPSTLRFLVKLIEDGPGSTFFSGLTDGATVQMTGPHGFFGLDDENPGDVVLVATGTGIAPMLPILEQLAGQARRGQRILYWGLRHARDLFIADEVRALCETAKTTLRIFFSQPDAAWRGDKGRITAAIVESLPLLRDPRFYMVGNGAMIKELKGLLVDAGVDRKRQIRTEAFFD